MARRRRNRQFNWLMVSGGLVAAAGLVVLARIPYFYIHSRIRGNQLLHQAQHLITSSNLTTTVTSTTSSGTTVPMSTVSITTHVPAKSVLGELQVAKIGLTAPVLQGTSDSELNVGVGHLSASVMPGQIGTSILAAHNATWFRHINQLQPGDDIIVKLPGQTQTFQVTGHRIVHTGTPVYNSSQPSLLLEACYPLDALYLTPYRYLVSARLVQSQTTTATSASTSTASGYYAKVPSKLAQEGLTLSTNSLPMGTLHYSGAPSLHFTESNQPLTASSALVTLYLAWLHASADGSAVYLHNLLPTVAGTQLANNPAYGTALSRLRSASSFDVTLHVNGDTLVSAKAVTEETVGTRGTYQVVVSTVAHGQELVLQSIVWKRLHG
ncbi:class D sortase [Alicyclobacillus sp. ALC3]|uniref:class D sortase n=1 Tax=Alicyclobacillus sp. ALC3 TaxID=2796143 RepID=UPI002378F43F|nr:class D sortase [Alicyclobacillus sp. ALC3]WDL95845.1 class D sortase [Alicyclobacillus sp. ALC3]